MATSKPRPRRRGAGRFSPSRIAWTTVSSTEVVLHETWDGDSDGEYVAAYPDLPEVTVVIRKLRGGQAAINLTDFTKDELEVFERLLNDAINKARPICTERDRRAEKEYENGDSSQPRLYRPVPQLHQRPREERRDGAGLQG